MARTRGFQRRHEPEHHAGRDRQRQREDEREAVHAQLIDVGLRGDQDLGHRAAQRAQRGKRDTHARRAAAEAEQQALHEKLPRNPRAAGPEGRAHRELPLPRHAASQQEVGDVRTGEQQHDRDRDDNDERRRPRQLVVHRAHLDQLRAERAVRLGMLGREPAHDGVDVGLGFRVRDSLAETRDDRGVRRSAIGEHRRRLHLERRPQVPFEVENRVFEGSRHDADDRVRPAIELHHASHRRGIAAEPPLPQAVPDHDDLAAAGPSFFWKRPTAEHRRDAEHRKRVGGHAIRLNAFRHVAAGEVGAPVPVRRHILERLRALLELHEVGVRQAEAALLPLGVPGEHERDALGLPVRQRLQHLDVDHAENGGVRADAQRQRRDCGRREARRPAQDAHAVPNILNQRSHRSISLCRGIVEDGHERRGTDLLAVIRGDRGGGKTPVGRARKRSVAPRFVEITGNRLEGIRRQQDAQQQPGHARRPRHGVSSRGSRPRAIRASASWDRRSSSAPAGCRV